MGLSIHIQTKYPEDECENYLSRKFAYLINGPEAVGRNCELKQLEKVLGIELNAFLRKPINLEPDTGREYYEYLLAEEANNAEMMKKWEKEIAKITKEWEENYDKVNEGWTPVAEMKKIVINLLDCIHKKPNYHLELTYYVNWGNYFTDTLRIEEGIAVSKEFSKIEPRNEYFIKDLFEMLNYVECVENKKHELVALVLM
jgi:hypothetical protein